MVKKIILVASLVALGTACSDDESADSSLENPVSAEVSAGDVMGSMGAAAAQANGKKLFVKVPHLYIRTGPGMSYQPVGTIPFNHQITVQESLSNGRWIKIGEGQYVGGRYLSDTKNDKAWIPAKYAH